MTQSTASPRAGHLPLAEKLTIIQRYAAAGWTMTPTRGKRPYRSGWQTERLDIEQMSECLIKAQLSRCRSMMPTRC